MYQKGTKHGFFAKYNYRLYEINQIIFVLLLLYFTSRNRMAQIGL